MDLGIEVILELFSKSGVSSIFNTAEASILGATENAQRIFTMRKQYIKTIDQVITFLQGKNANLARQLCSENFLPRASRFDQLDDLDWAFGNMGIQDKAKHLATLYLEDLGDFIVELVDENFGFSRYAERLGKSANSFDELHEKLENPFTYIDRISLGILGARIKATAPTLVCFSVPFPGNLYSAFRCAQFIKSTFPNIKTAMGGGFANTELRSLSDPRVFDFFDFITLDSGELPIELLINQINEPQNEPVFKRTFYRENEMVKFQNNSLQSDYKLSETGTPDYSDLLLDQYISVIEIANPMHSLWSDGRWNKLTMAHGCYWGKCTFCDVSLDYIKRYEPTTAKLLVDRMESMIAQTGESGFHFVDEAAPPALMRDLALEILRRNLCVTWWTNIRFEKSFSYDLCLLLKASGCIAVSGGLEVASDRLLKLIQKGVSVEQVAVVTDHFTRAGIMVHAYLMYGYPSQTVQETMDSLEMVRQMFELGIIQSGYWHQFALTAHSPVGLNPKEFGITPRLQPITFANNDLEFSDQVGINHDKFSKGLKKALYNYMHGNCFEFDLQQWFEFKIPKTIINRDCVSKYLDNISGFTIKPSSKIIWIGNEVQVAQSTENSKLKSEKVKISIHGNSAKQEIKLELEKASWLINLLPSLTPQSEKSMTYVEIKNDFESHFGDFELFWFSKPMMALKSFGLIAI